MYDIALIFAKKSESFCDILNDLSLQPKQYVLATIHRAENTDSNQKLESIFKALMRLSKQIAVVLPLHPRTRKALKEAGILETVRNSLTLIEPVGYLDMITLEKNAKMITTDSGGVQKEAFFFRVPCLVLREETEWTELTEVGCNKLSPPGDDSQIFGDILEHLNFDFANKSFSLLYGDGKAAQKITSILLQSNL